MRNEHYWQAIEMIAKGLLLKWDSLKKHSELEEALEYSIGCGGGYTFDNIGPYWGFWAFPSMRLELWQGGRNVKEVPTTDFLSVCRKIWETEKQGQQKLW